MIHPLRYTPKVFLAAAVVALAVFGVLASGASAASAKSKTPCWKILINDWYDGRIDGTYPIHCYRDALKHLPADVDTYSSARDDIKQALQKRITQGSQGGDNGNGTSVPPGSGGGSGGGGTGGSQPDGGGGSGGGDSNTSGPIPGAIRAGAPENADSLPVPLLVLGAVAFVLMAAGGAGFFVRRQRLRRDQLATAASMPSGPGGPR